jgi:hypothetical protein
MMWQETLPGDASAARRRRRALHPPRGELPAAVVGRPADKQGWAGAECEGLRGGRPCGLLKRTMRG